MRRPAASLKERAGLLRAEARALARGKTEGRGMALSLDRPLKNGPKNAAGRRAKLLLGELLIAMGKRADAEDPLKKVLEDYNDSTITADRRRGPRGGRPRRVSCSAVRKDANSLAFKESESAGQEARRDAALGGGAVPRQVRSRPRRRGRTKEALDLAPQARRRAHHDGAREKLEQTMDFDDADKLVKEALAVNPHFLRWRVCGRGGAVPS